MNKPSSRLRIGFVGDIALGPDHDKLYKIHGECFLHEKIESLFENVDLVIGNLECSVLSPDVTKNTPSNLYTSPKLLQCLKKHSNLHLCLANNHISDFGDDGVSSTLESLNKAGIPHFGAGVNCAAAMKPHTVRIGETTAGLVCASDFPYSNATKNSAGSAQLNKRRLIRQVTELKNECEHVIVILHADNEFQNFPAPYRIRLSRQLVDAGADAVIQHHPHVVQGIEIYKGRTIAYSLGNWAFKIGNYQSPFKQTKYGIFFVLEIPVADDGEHKFNVTHTMIDEMHRPVLLNKNDSLVQQTRLENISAALVYNKRQIHNNWFKACKTSLAKELLNTYYTLRKSGIRSFSKRIIHLIRESLFWRQLLGLASFGRI